MRSFRSSEHGGGATAAAAGAVAFWLALWQLASWVLSSPIILPGPVEVVCALVHALVKAGFWTSVIRSCIQILLGVATAYAAAIPLAFAAHRWGIVRALASPPLQAFKAAPIVCLIVLLLLWFGSAWVGFAAVILVAVPGLYFPALDGLDGADGRMRELFDVHRIGGARRLLAFTWLQVLPFVRAASATVVGMAWKAGVAAELIGMPEGSMGERIFQAKLLLETADVFAWTVVVVALAVVSERVVIALIEGSSRAAVRIAADARRPGPVATGALGRADGDSRAMGGALVDVRGARASHGFSLPVSLSLSAGDRVCLMAPSGSGKTTFLRVVAGLEPIVSGEVSVRARISMLFQDSRLIESATAVDNVLLFAAGGYSENDVAFMLGELIGEIDLGAPVATLSGGQRRRVELLRALLSPGDAVLLDEPFSGLDDVAHRRAAAWVREHLGGRALLVATHDPIDAELLGASTLMMARLEGGERWGASRDVIGLDLDFWGGRPTPDVSCRGSTCCEKA